jgi:8-oxo-dGTP diphosphatase
VTPRFPRPLVSVDVTIFTVAQGALRVVLVRRGEEPFADRWALPGGFVDVTRDADLEATARRKLEDKTGVAAPYLEQLGTFGSAARDPRGWTVTIAYFALMPATGIALRPGGNALEVAWFPVEGERVRPRLAFDHEQILAAAVARLRAKVEYTSLPAFFLPEEFTLGGLQRAFELLLGRAVEKSAFRRRVLAAGLLVEVPRMDKGRTRPAQLYKLKDKRRPVLFPRTLQGERA